MISRKRFTGLLFLTTLLLCGLRMDAAGNEKVTASPLPDWFSPCPGLALDAASRLTPRANASSTGEEFLLFDRQIDIATAATTTHIAYRITSQAGLSDGAQLTQAFDPSYESLAYHFIRLWRNGQVQDRLDLSEIKILQQERDLDRQMYNGQLSTLLLLHDVRVGDIIEYACTRTGRNPVFGGKFVETQYCGWVSPMRQQRLRVIVPGGRTVRFREQGGHPLTHTERRQPNGGTELWWVGLDLPPLVADAQAPDWFVQFPYVEFSEFEDWAEVASWALSLYELDGPLPAELGEKLTALTRGAQSQEAKALAVLDFVQREIRYLGIELGPGSHRPHQPSEVFKQRFGDCKDKTFLLCAMLRQLGISAHPMLVNSYRRDMVRQNLPSPYAFNHVIAQVVINDRNYHLDATQSYQRGVLALRNPAESSAGLPVRPNMVGLESWVGEPWAQARREVKEVYDFAGYDNPATVAVAYRYSGEAANHFRYYLANHSPEEINRDFINYHKRAHPNLHLVAQPKWEDLEARNTILLNLSFTVPDLWKNQDKPEIYKVEFYPWPLRDYINQPDNLTRTAPLSLDHPVDIVVRTIVNFPDDWSLTNSKESVATPWYDFTCYTSYQQRTLEILYQWVSRKDHVAAADLPAHVKKLEEIRKYAGYTLTHNSRLTRELARFSWNWIAIGLCALIVGGWSWFGWWLLRRPGPAEPPPVADPHLQGIAGWLLLPALGLVVNPLVLLYSLGQRFDSYFDQRIWIRYTAGDSLLYHPATAGLILFELAGNLCLLMLVLVTAALFYKCRRSLPKMIIAMLLYTPAFLLLDSALCRLADIQQTAASTQNLQQAARTALAACIWVPYFLVSRRVKATFIR